MFRRTLAPAFLILTLGGTAWAQTAPAALPNPYQPAIENWAKLPEARPWGGASSIAMDRSGNLWVLERCGGNTCAGRTDDPVLELPTGPSGRKGFASAVPRMDR